ncbi:MAG: hypothetical protein ACPGQL_01460 [Thermoplasmatota archaeon]
MGVMGQRAVVVLLAAMTSLALLPAPAAGQLQSCGEGLELFIRNPDITPDANGLFHVSGRLLVQFQVIGERASEIEAFGLSFGFDIPTGEEVCALPPAGWLTGLYLEGYAYDPVASDGFFIAINSNGQTSPQTDLGVAVHGYDASGQEIARFWGLVRLDNCGNPPELGCPDDPAAQERDVTMPWPILLPGDGADRPVPGFAFEFNERLSNLTVELNGEDVTGELSEWADRPMWDQDNAPTGGPGGHFYQILTPCTLPEPAHQCGPLVGPAYQWTGRDVVDSDVIRVIATDENGNVARKEIHIGSSVAGGTISDGLPILQMTFDESTVEGPPGGTAVLEALLQNTGGGEGHPFASAEVPEGWSYEWVPGHRPVPAGGSSEQALHVTIPADTAPDRYPVRAIIDYQQGSLEKSVESALNVLVVPPAPGGDGAEAAPTAGDDGEGEDSPLPGLALVLVALTVALARRRPT